LHSYLIGLITYKRQKVLSQSELCYGCHKAVRNYFPKIWLNIQYEGWSKISETEFIVGKRKHLQATRNFLLQIVCSDSSDPSTFQCMSGRFVWEWSATAVSYLVVCTRRLEIVSPSGCSSAWGRGRSRRGLNLESKAGGGPRGCCASPRIPWHSGPHGMAHCHGAEARYQKTVCEAVSDELHLEGVAERLCRQFDSWSGVGEETRDAPDPSSQRKRSALSWHFTGLASLTSAEVMTASFIVTTFVLSQGRSH
jgi:hypothetical protein